MPSTQPPLAHPREERVQGEAPVFSDPIAGVEAYLNDRFRRLPEAPRGILKITPSVDRHEAQDFQAGLEAGLFEIDALGFAQSELLPAAPRGSDRQKLFQMFWHRANGKRFLFREGVCQLAAASGLVLRYGWPRGRVRLEPNEADLTGLAYGVDLIVFDESSRHGLIFGEVKKNSGLLEALIRDMERCGARGPHDQADCRASQHRKFAACWSMKPAYFWAVAPGVRRAFRLSFTERSLALVEIDDIPHAGGERR